MVGEDVLGGDELVVLGLEQSHRVPEVRHLVLVGVVEDVIVLNEVLRDHQVVVHHEPHLFPPFALQTTTDRVVALGEVHLAGAEELAWRH